MKKSVILMVGLIFLTALGFYFFNPDESLKVSQVPEKEVLKVMPSDEKSPVRWLQVQNIRLSQTVTMEKKSGEWLITFPVAYPAETVAVEGLIAALRLSSRARRLLPDKTWEEYGLLKPNLKIGIQTEEGKTRRYLYVGEDSPVGPFVYARWEGEKEYFLIQRDLKRVFDRTLYSLRVKQVFRVPLREVTKMRIRSLEHEYEVEKRADGWFWLEPIPLLGKPLEKKYVDQIVSQYGDLYVKEFLDNEKKSPEDLGFGILSPWIKLWGQNPTISTRSQNPEGSVSAGRSSMASARTQELEVPVLAGQNSTILARTGNLEGSTLAGSDKTKNVEQITIGQEIPERDSFIARREGEKVNFLVARENIRKLFQIFETMSQEALNPPVEPAQSSKLPVDLYSPEKIE